MKPFWDGEKWVDPNKKEEKQKSGGLGWFEQLTLLAFIFILAFTVGFIETLIMPETKIIDNAQTAILVFLLLKWLDKKGKKE